MFLKKIGKINMGIKKPLQVDYKGFFQIKQA